jgi:hypothetical protein
MPVNVQLNDANFSLGPEEGFFYSVSKDLNSMLKVEADGTIVDFFPISLSQLRNPVKELHYDGTFFWTLEDLPSDLGIVIKKWRLFPFKTRFFPSAIPFEFRWQDELTLIHGPNIRWEADAFAVEHYHRFLDGSFLAGVSIIRLDSVEHLNIGDDIYLGPSDFGGFIGNEETRRAVFVNVSTRQVTLNSPIQNSYVSNDPVDYSKSLFLFNQHSFTGLVDNRGTLVQFSYPGKFQLKVDTGGKYHDVSAADYDGSTLAWVRGPQIIQLNVFNPTFDLQSSLEANLVQDDMSTFIEVFDLIADLNSNVFLKLQDRETTESVGTGAFTTTTFTPAPRYNFQTQVTTPVVNSIGLSMDTRFVRPFPSNDRIYVKAYVKDQFGFPVLGQSVQFGAVLSDSSPPGAPGTLSPVVAITNTSGIAASTYTPSASPVNLLVNITGKVL